MAPSVTPQSTHYALVIDAGSSGSRLQIYSWRDPDLERAEILQEVRDTQRTGRGSGRWWWGGKDGYKGKGKEREGMMERKALRRLVRVGKGVEGDDWVKRVEPGISTVDPKDIPNYLAPLLSHALQHIPPSQHSSTPIYLLATAGMRLLPESSRDAILQASCDLILNDYPFPVGGPSSAGPCGENIRVISGEEEGMWGWVAVNYLMDGFGHAPDHTTSTSSAIGSSSSGLLPLAPLADPPPDSSADSVTPVDVNHHSPTFGFLDMGGASTQLAFSPTSSELLRSGYPPDDLQSISLRLLSGEDVEWPVFVASWLGFGTNRARERYVEGLISKWRSEYETTGTSLDSPIVDSCLPARLQIPSPNPAKHPAFIGSGSFSACLTELVPLLEHATPCPADHCLFAGLPTPQIDFQREDQRGFIGISEYWYTSEQVLGLGGIWDWGEWEKGMSEFCARDWKDVEAEVEREHGWRGTAADLSRLQMQCFKGAWISNVLHEGIGIPRLVDAGGNDTLTGGDLGETNAEAERRAREKGLLEGKSRHHFQSMDEVGETAISWTLGKMVIEASKAVQPRSKLVENAWTARLGSGLGRIDNRLNELGLPIPAVWAYGITALLLFACLLSCRRRYRSSGGPGGYAGRRGRKPSISSVSPVTSKSIWSWVPGFDTHEISLEDGYMSETSISPSSSLGKSRFATVGRLRLWSLRLGNMLRKKMPLPFPFGQHDTRRSASSGLPLSMLSAHPPSQRQSFSQPPSPRGMNGNGFFTPALALANPTGLVVPLPRPGSVSPDDVGISSSTSIISTSSSPGPMLNGLSSAPTSPPRNKAGRPFRPRQNSYNSGFGFSSISLDTNTAGGSTGSGGWNDPPLSMLHPNSTLLQDSHSQINGHPDGILTPGAGPGPAISLSRNASRVNLSELGLAQRSTSRAGTPLDDTP